MREDFEGMEIPVQEIALAAREVPPEFVVSDEERKTLHSDDTEKEGGHLLPLIDLGPLLDITADEESIAKVKQEIGRVSEEWGFFQVINHGIPDSLLENVLEVVAGFFNLPLEEKQVYAMKPGQNQGYGRVLKPKIRPWRDAFRQVVRPRPTPDHDKRPKAPSAYRDVMDEYTEEIVKLVRRLTNTLSESLGLESNALQKAMEIEQGDYPAMAITANFYPKCPQPDRALGIYPHSDAGAMTVLHQNQVEGLQVLKDENWVPVKPVKNGLVVNVADQLEILSNGRLKSSKHRAVINNTTTRISIAAFCLPVSSVTIGPLPNFVNEVHPPLYSAMSYSRYSSLYFKRDMESKPLSLLDNNKGN